MPRSLRLHPGNMMVHKGEIVGALDFEWCMAGDPIADFTVEPHLESTWPGSHGPFISGYEGVAGPIDRHRLGLYQLVRNVTLCNVAAQHFSAKESEEYCATTLKQLESLVARGMAG